MATCDGTCGIPECRRQFQTVTLWRAHVTNTQASAAKRARHVQAAECDTRDDARSGGLPTETTADTRRGGSLQDGSLDAAAHLLAALDGTEHLSMACVNRISALLQPYIGRVLRSVASEARVGEEQLRAMERALQQHQAARDSLLSNMRHPNGPLQTRMRKLGYVQPTQAHVRTRLTRAADGPGDDEDAKSQEEESDEDSPDEDIATGDAAAMSSSSQSQDSCYDVDLLEDMKQMLTQDQSVVQEVAASQQLWREMAARVGTQPPEEDVIADVCDGAMFRERVLPLLRGMPESELLLVGLPYMDDIDPCHDSGPSSGKHNLNMQYVVWLNLSPHSRMTLTNIRLMCSG